MATTNNTDNRKFKAELDLRYEPARFINREFAFSWANNTAKPSVVMLGSDGKFWSVCFADAQKLNKMGFEFAK